MRLFVALELDPRMHETLARAQEALRATKADVGWTRPDQWHVTLKFLGETAEARVPDLSAAVARAAAASPPFDVHVGGIGSFPGGSKPRVIWMRVEDEQGLLDRLVGQLEREISPMGFPPESRSFRAHITLGRVRSPQGVKALLQSLREQASADAGSVKAQEIVLFRSDLGPGGAKYTALARAPLGAPTLP